MSYKNLDSTEANLAQLNLHRTFANQSEMLDLISRLTAKECIAVEILVNRFSLGGKDYNYINKPHHLISKCSTIISKLRKKGLPISSEFRKCRGAVARHAYVYFIETEDLQRLFDDTEAILKETRVDAIKRSKRQESQHIERLVKDYGKLGAAKRVLKHAYGNLNAQDKRNLNRCVDELEKRASNY